MTDTDKEQALEPAENPAMETGLTAESLDGARALIEGEIINARVVQVQDDLAFVNVGWKSDLPINREELALAPLNSAKEVVQVGDEIKVMVVRADEDAGILLSKKRADQEVRWLQLEEALAERKLVSGRVMEKTKGGLVLDVGVRGFVPASQAALGFVEDLGQYVGQTWEVRPLEVDRSDKRVVLSRKAVLEEEREKAQVELYAKLQVGQVIEGRVTRLATFGAFVDLGQGVEGLLHVSEIAWEHVHNPAERLRVGEDLKAQIIKIEPEARRISLSLKSLHPHPWSGVAERFPEGTITAGKVVRIATFGAFVRLAEGIDGLVHISQLADRRVNRPEDVVSVGQEVNVKILQVDEENRRLSLSMKALMEEAENEQVQGFLHGQQQAEAGLTIADLLKAKGGSKLVDQLTAARSEAKPAAKTAAAEAKAAAPKKQKAAPAGEQEKAVKTKKSADGEAKIEAKPAKAPAKKTAAKKGE